MNQLRRKSVLRTVAVVLCVFCCALSLVTACERSTAPGSTTASREPAERPNVVLFVMDTARGDRCSVNGYALSTTPELDRLGSEGVVYRNAWSPSSWTAPSHASLFTGLRPSQHGFMTERRMYLPLVYDTLAERLKSAGYATGCFTRNPLISQSFGLTQGFDEYEALFHEPATAHDADEAQQKGADWALRQRASGDPFLLFLNVLEPHAPYAPPEPWGTQFAGDATPQERDWVKAFHVPRSLGWMLGAETATEREMQLVNRIYDGGIAAADAAVGNLARRLQEAGELDRTLFVVLSDHGEYLGDHGRMDHVGGLHRCVLHVPLVVRFPGVFEGGVREDRTVRIEDLHPTVLRACGVAAVNKAQGEALQDLDAPRIAIAEIGRPIVALSQAEKLYPDGKLEMLRAGCSSVYDGRHHLLVWSEGATELYDVQADPAEAHDLSASEPETVARLRKLLDADK